MTFSVIFYSLIFFASVFLVLACYARPAQKTALQRPLNKPLGTIVEVSGESFDNDDGTQRQKIIARLKERELVTLTLEPVNRFDRKAIAVVSSRGQIGYVAKDDETAPYIYARLRDGMRVNASILNILGGTGDKPNYGVWLDVDIDIRNEARRMQKKSAS